MEPELEARLRHLEAQVQHLKRANLSPADKHRNYAAAVRLAGFADEAPDTECAACNEECSACANGCEECCECLPECWEDRLMELLCRPAYPTVRWGGFLQLDTGWVAQDTANRLAVGDVNASTGLRRVRLNVGGELREDASYLIDLDFAASGHPSFRDVYLAIHDLGIAQNVQFGYFQQPFGLDAMTSGRELLFLERQLPFAFDPFRQTGMGAHGTSDDELTTWAISAFRFPTDAFGVAQGESGGWALASRITTLPVYVDDGGRLVHFGFNYSFGDPGDNIVEYAIQPGFFTTDPNDGTVGGSSIPVFVDTGPIPTRNFHLVGGELAAGFGPFNFQSEVKGSLVNQINGPQAAFWGAYVSLAYVLTGEVRPYDLSRGVFDRVSPRRDFHFGSGGGSWEVALGWSVIDLNSKNIEGGRMQNIIVGLNRRLGPHVMFKFNVIRVLLDDAAAGRSAATVAAARVQAEF